MDRLHRRIAVSFLDISATSSVFSLICVLFRMSYKANGSNETVSSDTLTAKTQAWKLVDGLRVLTIVL